MAVLKVYKDVIDDVISAARELFLEDGVDEQVLQELKQSWETKLMASKAVDSKTEVEKQIAKKGSTGTGGSGGSSGGNTASTGNNNTTTTITEVANGNGLAKQTTTPASNQQQQQQQQTQASATTPSQAAQKQVVGQVAPNNHVQTPPVSTTTPQVIETKMVPIQITLPGQPGTNGPQRVLTIQVPAPALQDNLLHKVLTGQVITTTMNLPPSIASSVLQQHVNAAFSQLAPSMMSGIIGTGSPTTRTVIQNDGAHDGHDDDNDDEDVVQHADFQIKVLEGASTSKKSTQRLCLDDLLRRQLDGARDSSDDDDDPSDDDDMSENDDDDKDEDEQEMDDGGPEEEPLNSEDDVTDDDPGDLFDTDNVVVCQYDKITRSRNKWKFHLKDGIMNLKGEDYVFQKANGDAEW